MAALTATLGAEGRIPLGANYYIKRFTFTVANTGATDENISTGFSTVIGVIGSIGVRGATKGSTNYVLNSVGTATAAGTTGGLLAVESDVAAVHEVTVIGQE